MCYLSSPVTKQPETALERIEWANIKPMEYF
jgi:hypothetical protein